MENVIHQIDEKRFVLQVGNAQAVLQYHLIDHKNGKPVVCDFTSTFVPPEFRGKGFAEKLVRTGIAWTKEQGYELKASCWYAEKFIR